MTTPRFYSRFLGLALGLLLVAPAFAQDEAAVPALALHALPGIDGVEHPVDTPLLLRLSISNPAAEDVRQRNEMREAALQRYREEPVYAEQTAAQKLEVLQANRVVQLPVLTLGHARVPVDSLPALALASAKGSAATPRTLNWTSLRTNLRAGSVAQLESDEPLTLYYVVAPAVLQKLGTGKHSLVAVLDTSGSKNMWQGRVESPPVALALVKAGATKKGDAERSLRYVTGLYYVLDEQYDRALANAEALIADYPDYIRGWTQKGDALAGLAQYEAAKTAFTEARRLFYAKQARDKPPIPEPPQYIERRLHEMRQAINAAGGP